MPESDIAYHHVERIGLQEMQFNGQIGVVARDREMEPAFAAGLNVLILAELQLYFLNEGGCLHWFPG